MSGIKVDKANGILTLTFDRTDKKNAITNDMYCVLADMISGAEQDKDTRVILLRAEGENFTSGNDVAEFAQIATGTSKGPHHVGRFLEALVSTTCPIVAAVHGKAVGVGTTMLLHCDYVVVADNTVLTAPFVSLALVPEASSSLLLPARIGHARAFAMLALAEPVSGEEAVQWGLANKIVPVAELDTTALAVARKLAGLPNGALLATKRLMRDRSAIASRMQVETAEFLQRLKSAEAREAFTAFMQRRKPSFENLAD